MERSIYDYIEQIIEENSLPGYVDSPDECFYILPGGEMLGFYGEYGSRYTDHRDIFVEGMLDYRGFGFDFKEACIKYSIVQYAPEMPCAIIWKGQEITEAQQRVIDEFGIELEVE